MSNAPPCYSPWYFPVVRNNKSPDGSAIKKRAGPQCFICKKDWVHDEEQNNWVCPSCGVTKTSWKAPHARLSYEESSKRLEQGENVGIAARTDDTDDTLVLIDIDDYKFLNQMPETLTIKSRKRFGLHGYCWGNKEIKNIPTEHGEVRCDDQYVVAPGSYVETSKEEILKADIPEDVKKEILQDPNLGVYTVEKNIPPRTITYKELPKIFLEQAEKVRQETKLREEAVLKTETVKPTGKHSALHDLIIHDVVSVPKPRGAHPLHESETGANFSIKGNLATCWRHNVTLNALQFLVVKSGYMTCLQAGTGHKGSGAGPSQVTGDDGAIFWAWWQAKKDGLIPKDDKIPIRAMRYIAVKHGLIKEAKEKLSPQVYNRVLKIVREEY